jgi:hypothetical protein
MRLFITGSILLVALSLVAPIGGAAAPKPALYTGATVEFRNWTGDGITSDGGAYVDGGNPGLEVRVWINGSQDVTVGTFRSGRRINFSYAPATDVGQPTANPPAGALSDNAFMNIRNIGAMRVGDTKITRASFNTAVGYFRWLGGPNPSTGVTTDPSYGSQAVVVYRESATTWRVHTPVPAESGYFDGIPVAVDYTAGDLSVLLKELKGKLTPVGLYHMPFGLTVTCAACP